MDETVTLSTTKAGEYVYASFVPDEDGYYDVRGINATIYMCEITDTVTNKNLAYNIYLAFEHLRQGTIPKEPQLNIFEVLLLYQKVHP